MVLVELLAILIGLGLAGFAAYLAFQKRDAVHDPEVEKLYTPPFTRKGEPEQHIRTHGLAIFWIEIGSPKKIGTQVEVNMKSGKTAIYELRHIEPATGTDWNWYDLEFVRYVGTSSLAADSSVRPGNN